MKSIKQKLFERKSILSRRFGIFPEITNMYFKKNIGQICFILLVFEAIIFEKKKKKRTTYLVS